MTSIHRKPTHCKPAHRNLARPLTTICAALLMPLVSGCQGHKIVARINGDAITDEQYVSRLERVTPQEFQALLQTSSGVNVDAGAVALVTVIRERAVDLVAKQKNAVPSKETIDTFFNYQKLANPNLANLIRNGTVQEEDLKHNLRIQAEAIGIGTDGAQVDPKEVADAFNAAQNSPNPAEKLDIPEKYAMRLLRVKDPEDGQMALNRLKASGDFASEAAREGDRGQLDGTEQIFPVTEIQRLLPALYDNLKSLNAGQFAPAPLTLTVPQANGPQTLTIVAQLTRKIPPHKITLDEVRPELTTRLLQKKFQQWQQHFAQTLGDFLRSKDTVIEIDIERYRPLVNAFFKTPPEPTVAPGGPTGASGASAPNGSARTATPPPAAGSGKGASQSVGKP